MKTFTFVYDPECSAKNSLKKMKEVILTGVPYVEEDQMRSPSFGALLSVATEGRLEIFKVIHDKSPGSLYELSQIMNKDLGYISKEVRVLESIGLIELVKDSSGVREKIKPVAQYDRIVLDFDLALGQASNL